MKTHWLSTRALSLILVFALTGILGPVPASSAAFFSTLDIPGPPNSGIFGETVTVLPNGNFVVTDPYYPFYTNYTEAKGAVYLYSPNGVLISRLTGDRIGNSVGSGGITVLTNGDYVVNSPFWDSGDTTIRWGGGCHLVQPTDWMQRNRLGIQQPDGRQP